MSFASLPFIAFLAVFFAAYYLRPSLRWQNLICVAGSYYFYAWWDYRFAPLLFLSSAVDYWIGGRIARTEKRGTRRVFLVICMVSNLGLLCFFKYYEFFVDSMVVALAGAGIDVGASSLGIILPIGISFYTFQTMSYTIDIYRSRFVPKRDFLAYLGFVSFFPQLVAGPIERATSLLPQFHKVRVFVYEDAVSGCRLMLWGFFKKLAIADNLALVVDAAYASPATASPGLLLLATVCFAFQIYADFSGYSDIAAGVARWFGIRLMRNFAHPYFAENMADFWRRWHISLSTWFRDYLYIPLGGNRCSRAVHVRNLLITFLLSGLWHGAAWTYVLWGVVHAVFLITPMFLKPPVRTESGPGGGARPHWAGLRILRTFFLVCLAWVLFRADTLADAVMIYQKLAFDIWTTALVDQMVLTFRAWPRAFIALALFLAIEWSTRREWNPFDCVNWPRPVLWGAYTLMFWASLYFCPARTAPFIYFQF